LRGDWLRGYSAHKGIKQRDKNWKERGIKLKPDPRFANKPQGFWGIVKLISQDLGYTTDGKIRVFGIDEISKFLLDEGLKVPDSVKIEEIIAYLKYRANTLNSKVQNDLMDVKAAKKLFTTLKRANKPTCPIPLNKQKGEKRTEAFFTASINILIEKTLKENGINDCEFDPRSLLIFSKDGVITSVTSRRVDGCYPSVKNPVAVWEIKEYYYTTTFGSRVADGVYETMLDGFELNIAREVSERKIEHVLFIDAKYTWWDLGKSYLCRMIDILNMGLVSEVVFGKEIVECVPKLVKTWIDNSLFD
jgi:hypothetical protein